MAKALGIEVADFFRGPEAPKGEAPPSTEASEERRTSSVRAVAQPRGNASAQATPGARAVAAPRGNAAAQTVTVPRDLYSRLLQALEGHGELDADELREAHEVLVYD